MKPQKKLVLYTFALMISLVIGVPLLAKKELPPSIQIETKGQPTIGNENAPVHLVVFEEPKCPFCREFTKGVYPKIKSNYIDTGKITYTVIMVSFLPKSMPGALGLMCLYHANEEKENPTAFFSYLDGLYANQGDEESDWLNLPFLLKLAKEVSPQIDLTKMESCITSERYRDQIEKNTHYGREIMGGSLTTPALYINGSYADNLPYREISKKIEELINKNENKEPSK